MCAHHLVLHFWRLLVEVTDRKQAKSLFLCCVKSKRLGGREVWTPAWSPATGSSDKTWHDGSKSLKIEWPRGRFTFHRESFEKDSLTRRESDLPSSSKKTRAVSRKRSLIWIALHWETSDALFVCFWAVYSTYTVKNHTLSLLKCRWESVEICVMIM